MWVKMEQGGRKGDFNEHPHSMFRSDKTRKLGRVAFEDC